MVITHFPPVYMSDPKFSGQPLSAYFCNDWEEEIVSGRLSPDLWITGHTHYCSDIKVGRIRLLSQQRGYPGELGSFSWGVIEVI